MVTRFIRETPNITQPYGRPSSSKNSTNFTSKVYAILIFFNNSSNFMLKKKWVLPVFLFNAAKIQKFFLLLPRFHNHSVYETLFW